jgi:hypothetical protein
MLVVVNGAMLSSGKQTNEGKSLLYKNHHDLCLRDRKKQYNDNE